MGSPVGKGGSLAWGAVSAFGDMVAWANVLYNKFMIDSKLVKLHHNLKHHMLVFMIFAKMYGKFIALGAKSFKDAIRHSNNL